MQICDRKDCTGCSSCINICPKGCIELVPDEYGVEYPVIDEKSCVQCNKCKQVCPNHNALQFRMPIEVWAGCRKDQNAREKSASGGAASVFYENIIENGGVGYGVKFNEQMDLVFKRITDVNDLSEIRGSKYTFSHINDTYKNVKNDLIENHSVLFIGTSCQIAGLYTYLQKDYDKLITVDLICHGMPPATYLKEYLLDMENKIKMKIDEVVFRDNNRYELNLFHREASIFKESSRYNKFFAGYTNMLFYRENCYSCPYAQVKRISDITIGDYWGQTNQSKLAPEDKGVSMILVNTEQGKSFLKHCISDLNLVVKSYQDATAKNEQLIAPSKKHPYRKEFLEIYKNSGYIKAADIIISRIIMEVKQKERKQKLINIIRKPYRRIKGILRYLKDTNRSGQFCRKFIKNKLERRKLVNKEFTILSNNCIGGVISHDMKLQFKSPTVNLYITPTDFTKLLENLEYYLSQEITEIPSPLSYPVGILGDIKIYFKHYNSIEEGIEKWNERKERIDYNNMFVMMTDRWCCPYSTLERFDKLPYKNKICFTAKAYPEFSWCKQVEKRSNGCVWIITNIMNLWGKRLYQYAEDFDYIQWLNNRN